MKKVSELICYFEKLNNENYEPRVNVVEDHEEITESHENQVATTITNQNDQPCQQKEMKMNSKESEHLELNEYPEQNTEEVEVEERKSVKELINFYESNSKLNEKINPEENKEETNEKNKKERKEDKEKTLDSNKKEIENIVESGSVKALINLFEIFAPRTHPRVLVEEKKQINRCIKFIDVKKNDMTGVLRKVYTPLESNENECRILYIIKCVKPSDLRKVFGTCIYKMPELW
ncbi:hypothetical protein TUBRATIS_004570 [Tubulinosema ratisbonensis]|uniref:Uncharacterized protein n=1 Tax=Tubulinosema ratisbonensis TaxID=291195 RepID=A0A437APC0_9MICR|nr:hypothetical protein TUBRATIS_004570 [Tubulinosema ratisbonensis]